jgi:hypothetical protein
MPNALPTVPDLVALHLESMYVIDEADRLVAINDLDGGPPPRLSLVRSPSGNRCLLSKTLPEELCEELLGLAALEPVEAEVSPLPLHYSRYVSLLASHAPVRGEYAGPAFVLPRRECRSGNAARLIGTKEAPLLDAHFGSLRQELDEVQPLAAVIEDGVVVAVCCCVRRRTAAIEAGVETASGYRGRGFARDATERWAAAMYAESLLPLYSASFGNTASLRVASALGGRRYAVDFSLR